MKWERAPLSALCANADDIRCGPFGTQLNKDEFREEGVPLWGIKQVNVGFSIQTKEFLARHQCGKAKAVGSHRAAPRRAEAHRGDSGCGGRLAQQDVTDGGTARFGIGHFDLIVIDEAHRSVYQRYRETGNQYAKKVEDYLRSHQDEIAIQRLRNNQPLTPTDLQSLEQTLLGIGENEGPRLLTSGCHAIRGRWGGRENARASGSGLREPGRGVGRQRFPSRNGRRKTG